MKKILHKKWAGFSLIEALIAALVVGLGLLGLAKLQGHVFQGSSVSRMQTRALNLAQEKIEELRAADYSTLADGNDTKGVEGDNATLTRNWTISDCPNTVPCKQVLVTMSWTDSSGVGQSIQLTSNISNQQPVNAGMALAPGP